MKGNRGTDHYAAGLLSGTQYSIYLIIYTTGPGQLSNFGENCRNLTNVKKYFMK
jgi:hypothetical protein